MNGFTRRRLLAILAAPLAGALPVIVRAQSGKRHRLGILGIFGPEDSITGGRQRLLEALAVLGYAAGRNLVIEERYANGKPDQLPALAVQLVGLGIDVIVTEGTPATLSAQKATRTIPIVTNVGDPVAAGFARDLRRPGGNITGMSQNRAELARKQVELLRIMLPATSTIGVVLDPASPGAKAMLPSFTAAAKEASIATRVVLVPPNDIDRAFEELSKQGIRAAVDFSTSSVDRVASAAIRHRVATMTAAGWRVDEGILASVDAAETDPTRLAGLLDKIFRGANPAEIPFDLAARFEVTINAKTAASLGIRLTPELLLRADRVIE